MEVKVIGGGLAGTETALYLAGHGIKVTLCDIKPKSFTPAHTSENFCELVCSNSLKSNDVYGNASGLLKEELRALGSEVIKVADETAVPAGNALAVDRNKFSQILTEKIKSNANIRVVCEEVYDIDPEQITVVATGPLTTDKLSERLSDLVGDKLHFYDASAPVVSGDSVDMNHAFYGDRYGKGNGDHLNCPMNKEEYETFVEELLKAERANLHSFEKGEIFEGCMPIEVMAGRGKDTLRFGPLKPVGLDDPKTGRWPYACLQLRREDENADLFNLVGFQTNLKFPEQKRVFGIIPALKNAEYHRYGVMHRNTFIDSPKILDKDLSLKKSKNTYFAGQITGVEGYVESVAVGLLCGIYIERKIKGLKHVPIPETTVLGSLIRYVTETSENFQPMNANYGILPQVGVYIRDKAQKKKFLSERSLKDLNGFIKEIKE